MTLLEALKQLAEKYPKKWGWIDDIHGRELYSRAIKKDEEDATIFMSDRYSTEDCDRILAEHGLVMWVECSLVDTTSWWGYVLTNDAKRCVCGTGRSTKRLTTESTFIAALEYILKDKP